MGAAAACHRSQEEAEVEDYYTIHEKLGVGSFAVVKRLVRKNDKKEFAVKIVKKKNLNAQELLCLRDEVEIMFKIQHPNIVQLYEIFDTPKCVFMIMELLTGGELFQKIAECGSFSEREAAKVVKDVTEGILYLHKQGIVHRDLKPENILYRSRSPKSDIVITDFGLAKYLKNPTSQAMTSVCGTPLYAAPEILTGEPYGPEVDLWSVGVILYILLCGAPPFQEKTKGGRSLYTQITRGKFNFDDPIWKKISLQAKDIVSGLLKVDRKKRYTTAQILRHPWVTGKEASSRKFPEKFTKNLKEYNIQRSSRLQMSRLEGSDDVIDISVGGVPKKKKKKKKKKQREQSDQSDRATMYEMFDKWYSQAKKPSSQNMSPSQWNSQSHSSLKSSGFWPRPVHNHSTHSGRPSYPNSSYRSHYSNPYYPRPSTPNSYHSSYRRQYPNRPEQPPNYTSIYNGSSSQRRLEAYPSVSSMEFEQYKQRRQMSGRYDPAPTNPAPDHAPDHAPGSARYDPPEIVSADYSDVMKDKESSLPPEHRPPPPPESVHHDDTHDRSDRSRSASVVPVYQEGSPNNNNYHFTSGSENFHSSVRSTDSSSYERHTSVKQAAPAQTQTAPAPAQPPVTINVIHDYRGDPAARAHHGVSVPGGSVNPSIYTSSQPASTYRGESYHTPGYHPPSHHPPSHYPPSRTPAASVHPPDSGSIYSYYRPPRPREVRDDMYLHRRPKQNNHQWRDDTGVNYYHWRDQNAKKTSRPTRSMVSSRHSARTYAPGYSHSHRSMNSRHSDYPRRSQFYSRRSHYPRSSYGGSEYSRYSYGSSYRTRY